MTATQPPEFDVVHHPADMNSSEYYEVIDPKGHTETVYVSRLMQHQAFTCSCRAAQPCVHVQRVTGKTPDPGTSELRQLRILADAAYEAGRRAFEAELVFAAKAIDQKAREEMAIQARKKVAWTRENLRDVIEATLRGLIPDAINPHLVLQHTCYPEAYKRLQVQDLEYEFYRKAAIRAMREDVLARLERLGTPGCFSF